VKPRAPLNRDVLRHNLAHQQMEAPAKIERAAMQDVLSIKELLRETWHDTYASLLPKAAIETVTSQWHAPALLAEQIQSPDIYFAIARDGGVVAGVITARKQDDALSLLGCTCDRSINGAASVESCWNRLIACSVTLKGRA
jgi:hypothetical protein